VEYVELGLVYLKQSDYRKVGQQTKLGEVRETNGQLITLQIIKCEQKKAKELALCTWKR